MFSKKARDVEQDTTKTEKNVSSLNDAFRAINPSTLAAVAGVTALIGAFKNLVGVGSNIVNTASHFEQVQKSLETVLQSAEKGAELFEQLRQFSFETTFGVDELASASSQLLNAGVSTKLLQDDLKMLGDLAQGDKNKFAELSSVFAKVQNTGRATSIQLQQIALRGIPIQKTLKEMGVVGTASAEQLTEAFKKLTDEGGQFHNAMDNIIDTIEGKRGFISDTLKEINVNFGEVTGITDAYKFALDAVYFILDKVNNALMAWQDNPLAKAILSGAVAVAVTGLATVIGVGLVSAIIKLNSQLAITATLKAALSGPVGWIVGGITAIVGVTAAITGALKAADKRLEAEEKITAELQKQKEIGENYKNNPYSYSRNDQLDQLTKDLDSYKQSRKKVTEELEKANKELNDYKKLLRDANDESVSAEFRDTFYNYHLADDLDELEADINERINRFTKSQKMADGYIQSTENQIATLKKQIDSFGDSTKLEEVFKNVYSNIKDSNKELADLQDQLNQVNLYRDMNGKYDNNGRFISFSSEEKKQIDEAVKYLQTKINDLKIKIQLEGAQEFEKTLQKVLGFSDEQASKYVGKSGVTGADWLNEYFEKIEKDTKRKIHTDELLGVNGEKGTKGYVSENIQNVMKLYETLMNNAGEFGLNKDQTALDNTTKRLREELDKLWVDFKTAGGSLEEFQELTGNTTSAISELSEEIQYSLIDTIKGFAKGYAENAISGTDVGTFVQSLQTQGSPLVALLEVLIKDIIEVCGGSERVKYLLDGIKNVLQAFSPLLTAILNILTAVELVIRPLLNLINRGLEAVFGKFNKWFDDFYKQWEINEDKKEDKEKDLTSQYEALLKAIREQEEYYLRKKAEMNAWSLKNDALSYTPVNDMILTPHGNFSTNPKDTIIATKNPSGLGGGDVKVVVNNYSDSKVDVQQRNNNGMKELLVTISQQIASDVAGGYNGWDSAFAMQQQRIGGRRL